MSFRTRWQQLSALGVREDDVVDERRRLSITNQGAILGVASCAAFAVGYTIAGPFYRDLALANVVVVALHLAALALSRAGRRTLAKVGVLVPVHALIVFATMRLGLDVGFHYYFFLFGALPFLFFGENEGMLRAAFAVLSTSCITFVCYAAPRVNPVLHFSGEVLRTLEVVSASAVMGTLALIVVLFTGDTTRAEGRLAKEHARSERLLLNILPAAISTRLKDDDKAIADGFAEVTVLFADLVGFTELSQKLSPTALVDMLNYVFSAFDDLAAELGLEKIKTIGDCYMVAAGLPDRRADHVEAAALMALGMRDALVRINRDKGHALRLRIGLHTGPVIAGVIGKRKFIYDLWGETVNLASRMESSGIEQQIQVTRAVRDRLSPTFDLESRGTIKVKGVGELETYLLHGKTAVAAPSL